MTSTRFIIEDLPYTTRRRVDLKGLTMSIEVDQHGTRCIAERIHGKVFHLHYVAPERADDDDDLLADALWLAHTRNADLLMDVVKMPPCPRWCKERHSHPDDAHFGPGASIQMIGSLDEVIFSLVQEPGGEPELQVSPPGFNNEHHFDVDQIRVLRDGLSGMLAAYEGEDGQ